MPDLYCSFSKGPNIAIRCITTHAALLYTTLRLPTEAENEVSLGLHVSIEGPASPALQHSIQDWLDNYSSHNLASLPLPNLMLPEHPSRAPFQHKVWQAIQQVPFGATLSYQALAALAGNPKAARAAGTACKNNLFPLFLPCHRILASSGALGGFSQDPQVKIRLLEFEKIPLPVGTPLACSHSNDPQGGCHEQPKRDDAQSSPSGVRK